MKINNLLKMFTGALVMTFIISSCADDFTEEDLLQAQYDLAQQQQDRADARQDSIDNAERQANVDALNQAGELVSLQLTIVDLDGTPVDGADVSLRAAAGGEADEQTATSTANGTVFFDRVAIGGNTVNISGAGITPATLQADFGSIQRGVHYEIINGSIIPTPVTESAVITVISSNAATATVSGNVTIETDVTNTESEFPSDVIVKANFNNSLQEQASFSLNYFFTNSGNEFNIGEAAVDATTGNYTLTVPANITFQIRVPDITTTQTIAISQENGVQLDRPEYRDVEAAFGPNSGSDFIRGVDGAIIMFDEPNGGGTGFTLDSWAKVPRDIGSSVGNNTTLTDNGSYLYKFTDLGSGYTESPEVAVDDPTADVTYAEAHIEFAIMEEGLTVSEAGAGLGAGSWFDLRYDEKYDSADNEVGTNEGQLWDSFTLYVNANGSGEIVQDSVNAAIEEAIESEDQYFDQDDLDALNDYATNIRLVSQGGTTQAVLDLTAAKSRVVAMAFNGENFTEPSFTFSGGGGASQANLTISDFETKWTFALNNENITAYSSVPGIFFEFTSASLTPTNFQSSTLDILDLDGNFDFTDGITDRLEVNTNGEVVYQDALEDNRTNFFSATMPNPVITNPQGGVAPTADVNINTNGEVTGINDTNNEGTADNFSNTGYNSRIAAEIMPAADGAPGSGAMIELTGGSFNGDGTYRWNGGFQIKEGGSGYLQDLNQQNLGTGQQGFFMSSGSIFSNRNLDEGQTLRLDINYGTGNKVGNF